jgi:uncharacterized protein
MKPTFSPVTPDYRLELLDVLRGSAICGIFFVNIEIMHCVFVNQGEYLSQFNDFPDRLTYRLMQLFFYSKFFPIFSLLFGLGISMQVLKQKESGRFTPAFFFRRTGFLFIIGSVHVIFLWSGDVLHIYALLGLMTFFLLKMKKSFLILIGLCLLVFPIYDVLLEKLFSGMGFNPSSYLAAYPSEEIIQVIRHGSYWERIHFNIVEYISNLPLLLGFFTPLAFSMFLLGIYLGKIKVHSSINGYVEGIKRSMIIAAIAINFYRIIFIFFLPDTAIFSAYRPVFLQLILITDIFFGIFYLWGIAWLYARRSSFAKLIKPLAYIGRMALSNYLLQSVFGFVLFSSLGFGLYERLTPAVVFLIPIGTVAIQALLSRWWLAYFHFGPVEWVWRCLSYGKFFPIAMKNNY